MADTARPATAALRLALQTAGDGPLPADRDWAGVLALIATEALGRYSVTMVTGPDDPVIPEWQQRGVRFTYGMAFREPHYEPWPDYVRHDRALALAARAWEEREAAMQVEDSGNLRMVRHGYRLSFGLSADIRALVTEPTDP
jgi:hypothetical protein